MFMLTEEDLTLKLTCLLSIKVPLLLNPPHSEAAPVCTSSSSPVHKHPLCLCSVTFDFRDTGGKMGRSSTPVSLCKM